MYSSTYTTLSFLWNTWISVWNLPESILVQKEFKKSANCWCSGEWRDVILCTVSLSSHSDFGLLEWTQELSFWCASLAFPLLSLKIFFCLSSFLHHIHFYISPWLSGIFQALLFHNQCHSLFHWVFLLVNLCENNKSDCLGKDYLFCGYSFRIGGERESSQQSFA